jgi:predicted MPP superfamily phosphohydrolase
VKRALGTVARLGLTAAAWGHVEAGRVRLRTVAVTLPLLPAELAGLRIAHLSDFHLGFQSRGERRRSLGCALAR